MIYIHNATIDDIPCIVNIHERAFAGFFLTKLGPDFLFLYYKSVLLHPQGILLVSDQGDGIIGFCAGATLSANFNSKLIKSNLQAFCWEGLKLLFSRPISLWHLFRNMSKENSKIGDKGEYAELLSIAVNPDVQHSGAGKNMLLALEEEVRNKGGKVMSLTTDFYDNDKAIAFYRSLGYKEWYDFKTYPNRRMYRLLKEI